jgi:hypothetical protein
MEIEQHTWVNMRLLKKFREEILKYLELNENENTSSQDLWEASKVMLWGKLIEWMSTLNISELK